eukprot:TRINITY_DN11580_c0_g1_i1.p1 TRINITY_DN11580_c0_g1~~TRINITY_DN11580_c0_g1_i1.p1  ORF type:complete len:811 (-),score=121.63 TRINITY_DN11580_c0_g1_i1:69-2207(-)
MNQDNCLEDSYKIPFLLSRMFGVPAEQLLTDKYLPEKVIPKYRIVGFPEHCYTRSLSLVGEFMGAAEWTFVTITQRVLSYPLLARAHYGHPDFFDGFWVRTRGGPSKASTKVNVNEDIFAGYEIFSRGERITYVEFIQQQKGRESEFFGAFTFEQKLAMGAAQQVRSRDVYTLNKRLQFFKRLSLLHGTLGFYITNTLMAISIDMYMYALIMFQVGNMTFNHLGLLGSKIAVPFLIQVGFVQAIPMLIEMIIQMGFVDGILYFIKNLPFSMFFFIFHLKTKSYYFMKGLLTASGGYLGTGRLFGLKSVSHIELFQRYAQSHFLDALVLSGSCIAYGFITSDPFLTGLVRVASTMFAAICWLLAPILFNPFPSNILSEKDRHDFSRWISSAFLLSSEEIFEYEYHKDAGAKRRWWDTKCNDSWQAWWYYNWIWENENLDQLRTTERIFLFFANLVIFALRYGPWVLLASHLWNIYSLALLGAAVLIITVFLIITCIGNSHHGLFGILRLPFLFLPVFLIIFYVWVGVSVKELLVSIMLFVIAFYAINEILVEIYSMYISLSVRLTTKVATKKSKKPKLSIQDIDEPKDQDRLLETMPVNPSVKRSLWARRVKMPRRLMEMHKIWPMIMYIWFAVTGFFVTLFSDTMTALLYNARVASSWQKELWFEVLNKPYKDAPFEPTIPNVTPVSEPSTPKNIRDASPMDPEELCPIDEE